MPQKVMDLATTLYACGIDMERTTLFVQSEVPGHADLTWLFNTITPLGELERMTQFKDKREQFRATVNVGPAGLPGSPGRRHPPVQGRGGARRERTRSSTWSSPARWRVISTRRFGDTFPECQALLTATPRVAGAGRRCQDEQEQGQHHRRSGNPGADLEEGGARQDGPGARAKDRPRHRRRSATSGPTTSWSLPRPSATRSTWAARPRGSGASTARSAFTPTS